MQEMSDSEIQRIWQALNNLAQHVAGLTVNIQTQGKMIEELRTDVKTMAANGCSKAVQHSDHESRLRSLETSRTLASAKPTSETDESGIAVVQANGAKVKGSSSTVVTVSILATVCWIAYLAAKIGGFI